MDGSLGSMDHILANEEVSEMNAFVFADDLLYEILGLADLELSHHVILHVPVLVVECSRGVLLHLSERYGNKKSLLDFTLYLAFF